MSVHPWYNDLIILNNIFTFNIIMHYCAMENKDLELEYILSIICYLFDQFYECYWVDNVSLKPYVAGCAGRTNTITPQYGYIIY